MTGYAEAWSPDGRWLLFRQEERDTRTDILRLDLETPGSEPEALVRTPHAAGGADVSPDGRWLAYFAQESGLWEVSARRFGPGGGRWQISTQGGAWPRWSASGDRLYFLHGEGVWAVEVAATETSLRPSRPEEVIIPPGNWMGLGLSRKWDLHAGRFLLVRQAGADEESGNQLVVVTNWLRELERLVPTN